MSKEKKPWWMPVAHFAAHTAVGTLIFLIIGIPAVLLSYLVHWLESIGVSSFTILVLSFLENAITITDAMLFVVFLALGAFKAAKEFIE